ncbi:hypothetical protein LPJ66_008164 [Kickxella alabastrina]|uniref:Uncharacterized protein n=1 Tax=Kickxella alabastrina TaxID=61397 RepID=A0ACC1I7G5_9FUNG|nr:hypothetical protein LPJ66_008164 [Kickxella alabastrina]
MFKGKFSFVLVAAITAAAASASGHPAVDRANINANNAPLNLAAIAGGSDLDMITLMMLVTVETVTQFMRVASDYNIVPVDPTSAIEPTPAVDPTSTVEPTSATVDSSTGYADSGAEYQSEAYAASSVAPTADD